MKADPKDPAERRRAPRIPCKIETDVAHAGASMKGKLLDLTIYGAFVHAPELPHQAGLVRLTFYVRPDREITLQARVAWQVPGEGAGVEFVGTGPDDVREISESLADLK